MSLRCSLLVLFQDTLLLQLLGSRAALELLLEAVSPHVLLEALLIRYNARGSLALGEDVSYISQYNGITDMDIHTFNQLFFLGSLLQVLAEAISVLLTFKFQLLRLKCPVSLLD